MRRISANIVIAGARIFEPGVIELESGVVKTYYCLEHELPMTEWMPGTIEVKNDEKGILRAYQGRIPLR